MMVRGNLSLSLRSRYRLVFVLVYVDAVTQLLQTLKWAFNIPPGELMWKELQALYAT